MAKGSLDRRMEGLSRPVSVRVTVCAATMIRLRVICGQRGFSVGQAVGEAVRDWTLAQERFLAREGRLRLEGEMRRAAEGGFRGSLGGGGLTVPAGSAISSPMANSAVGGLRERREAIGISREKLAHRAGISSASIEQFEAGARPQRSKALRLLEVALDKLEQERAAS